MHPGWRKDDVRMVSREYFAAGGKEAFPLFYQGHSIIREKSLPVIDPFFVFLF